MSSIGNTASSSDFRVCTFNLGGRRTSDGQLYDKKVAEVFRSSIEGLGHNNKSNYNKACDNINTLCLKVLEEKFPQDPISRDKDYSFDFVKRQRNYNFSNSQKLRTAMGERFSQSMEAYPLFNEGSSKNPEEQNALSSEFPEIVSSKESCKDLLKEIKADIFCFQETHWLNSEGSIPQDYSSSFMGQVLKQTLDGPVSHNGILWNTKRFTYINSVDLAAPPSSKPTESHSESAKTDLKASRICRRALGVLLEDRVTQKQVLVVSAHIQGCNPFDANPIKPKNKNRSGKLAEHLSDSSKENRKNVPFSKEKGSKPKGEPLQTNLKLAPDEKNEICDPLSSTAGDELITTAEETATVKQAPPIKCDSDTGDKELKNIIDQMLQIPADSYVLGGDFNVTPFHPRLDLLRGRGFKLSTQFHYPTSINTQYMMPIKIDYVAVRGALEVFEENVSEAVHDKAKFSDHKPVVSIIRESNEDRVG